MTNRYRSPNANIVGATGQMYNEATKIEKKIDNKDYGLFANDNTYSVTFNPYINKPQTKYIQNIPSKQPPQANQNITKPLHEPCVGITDGGFYIHEAKVKSAPLLPPYLNMPTDEAKIQGSSDIRT